MDKLSRTRSEERVVQKGSHTATRILCELVSTSTHVVNYGSSSGAAFDFAHAQAEEVGELKSM